MMHFVFWSSSHCAFHWNLWFHFHINRRAYPTRTHTHSTTQHQHQLATRMCYDDFQRFAVSPAHAFICVRKMTHFRINMLRRDGQQLLLSLHYTIVVLFWVGMHMNEYANICHKEQRESNEIDIVFVTKERREQVTKRISNGRKHR